MLLGQSGQNYPISWKFLLGQIDQKAIKLDDFSKWIDKNRSYLLY